MPRALVAADVRHRDPAPAGSRRPGRRLRVAAGLAAALVVTVSLLPAGDAGTAGTLFGVGVDKWLHAAGYAALAALAAAGFRRPWPVVVAAVALLGVGVELAQLPLPTRQFSVLDATANAVGATVGVAARWLARAVHVPG